MFLGFNIDALIIAITFIVVLVFMLMIVRSLAGLTNETIGYQLSVLSFGVYLGFATIAISGQNYWPGYDLESNLGVSKNVTLSFIFVFQVALLLISLRFEQLLFRYRSASSALKASISAACGLPSLLLILLANARWSYT